MQIVQIVILGALLLAANLKSEELETLRTHTLYIPYIDEDVRMRYWGISNR